MIIELVDGTEFELPDSLTDEQAQAIVDALTKNRVAADQASAVASEMQARFDLAKAAPAPGPQPDSTVVEELRAIRAVLERGFARMIAAQLADTVIENDPLRSEPTRAVKEMK